MMETAVAEVTAVTANVKKASLLLIAVAFLIALPLVIGCEATARSDAPTADSFQLPAKPTGPNRYVQDLAGILTPNEEKRLVDLATKVEKSTTAEMLFLTVEIDDPDNLRGLADRVLHEWGVGKQDKDNGIVIAVAAKPGDFTSINTGTRKRRYSISTGYGTEGIIPDLKANEIAETKMVPLFQKNEWAEGLNAGGSAVADLFYADTSANGATDSEGQADLAPGNDLVSNNGMPPLFVTVLAFIALIGLSAYIVYALSFKKTEEDTYTPPIVDVEDDEPLLGTFLTGAVLESTLESSEPADDSGEEYHRPRHSYSDDGGGGSSSSSSDDSGSSGFDIGSFGGGGGGGGGASGDC